MTEDESQTKAASGSREGKALPQPGQSRSKDWKTIKIKPKEQAKAERLFFQYCYPESLFWEDLVLKQAALDILSPEFIGENELKGHAGHKKIYPVPLGDLIIHLVEIHSKYVEIIFYPGDILKEFDTRFDMMAAMARMGGVRDKELERMQEKWRKEISLTVAQGEFPSNWRELAKVELISAWKYRPRSEAEAFAIVFLGYVPQARDYTISRWVNAILESLGLKPMSSAHLRDYIKNQRRLRLPQQITK
jgi:hypothetical protein